MLKINPSQTIISNAQQTQKASSFEGNKSREMRMLYRKSLKSSKVNALINDKGIPHAEKIERIKNMADSKLGAMSLFDKIRLVFKKSK